LADPHLPHARDATAHPYPSVTADGEAGSADASADGGTDETVGDDEALVRAAQGGDVDAFGRLYERYVDTIYGYVAFHLGMADEAEDVAGQVFLRALESLPRYRWMGLPFRAWLFRIAHNLVADLQRSRTRHPVEPLPDGQADHRRLGDPAGWLAEQSTREALVAAVGRLAAAQRQVILLKFGLGLPNAEVAAVLGRTEGAVKAVQHAALTALRRRLAPLGVGPGTPARSAPPGPAAAAPGRPRGRAARGAAR